MESIKGFLKSWTLHEVNTTKGLVMKNTITALLVSSLISGAALAIERPSDAELHAYKAYHHAEYLEITAKSAGGTNKLIHTTTLPTEGNDPVVSPALDHLYSKAVVDLTEGPVILTLPEVKDRYFSLHVTDQEHYTIYDEIRPVGKYVFVRHNYQGDVPEGSVIESRGNYPHIFIRTQVFEPAEIDNVISIQEMIGLEGITKELKIKDEDYVQFTIESHDVYPQNAGLLDSVASSYSPEDHAEIRSYLYNWYAQSGLFTNEGAFGPIDSDEEHSNDPVLRAAGIIGHLGLPVHHAIYTPIFITCDGERLNGSNNYSITIPYDNPGVDEFWSVTRYSQITGNTVPGAQDVFNAYNTKPDENGNVTITFSSTEPNDGTYWMPVNENEPYYFVERYYAPDMDKLVTAADSCPTP